jgi:hypothetical protein
VHQKKPFTCPETSCNKTFGLKFLAIRHLRTTHLGEKLFVCPEVGCSEKFGQKGQAKRHHRIIHLKEKPYSCPETSCYKMFSQKFHALTHHRSVHMLKSKETGEGVEKEQTEVTGAKEHLEKAVPEEVTPGELDLAASSVAPLPGMVDPTGPAPGLLARARPHGRLDGCPHRQAPAAAPGRDTVCLLRERERMANLAI